MATRRASPAPPSLPPSSLSGDERLELERLRQKDHDRANEAMREVARAREPREPTKDVPLWLKITGAALAAMVAAFVLTAYVKAGFTESITARMDYVGRIRDAERDQMRDRLAAVEAQLRADAAADVARTATLERVTTQLQDALRRVERIEQDRRAGVAPRPGSEDSARWAPTNLPPHPI